MTDGNTDFLERQVQALQGDVSNMNKEIGGLTSSINHLITSWERNDADATTGRRELHRKVEESQKENREQFEFFKNEMHSKVNVLANRMEHVNRTLATIEPSIKKFDEEKLRTEGAKRLGAYIWMAIATATGAVGWAAHEIISVVFQHPMPPTPPGHP